MATYSICALTRRAPATVIAEISSLAIDLTDVEFIHHFKVSLETTLHLTRLTVMVPGSLAMATVASIYSKDLAALYALQRSSRCCGVRGLGAFVAGQLPHKRTAPRTLPRSKQVKGLAVDATSSPLGRCSRSTCRCWSCGCKRRCANEALARYALATIYAMHT